MSQPKPSTSRPPTPRSTVGAPSWCLSSWCYVNTSACVGKESSPSSYVQDAVDLGYSYSTCDSEDSFTQYYNLRDGVVQLCSVFATPAPFGLSVEATKTSSDTPFAINVFAISSSDTPFSENVF